jgi:serine/threonine protein kinase
MALSKHPHVLRVYGSFVHGSKLYIVTPYMAVGKLKTTFENSTSIRLTISFFLKKKQAPVWIS